MKAQLRFQNRRRLTGSEREKRVFELWVNENSARDPIQITAADRVFRSRQRNKIEPQRKFIEIPLRLWYPQ